MSDSKHVDPMPAGPDPEDLVEDSAEFPIRPDLYEDRPLWKRIALWFAPNLTAFIASFCIMVLELVAGRLIARYLGSSNYTWTSVIGVVLGGITIGNLVGGRLADWFKPATVLAVLFLLASGTCLTIPFLNAKVNEWRQDWSGPRSEAPLFVRPFFVLGAAEEMEKNRVGLEEVEKQLAKGVAPEERQTLEERRKEIVTEMDRLDGERRLPWSAQIFFHVLLVFLLPSTLLGTIGPVVAKMALDQGRRVGKTVGNVYAWGALGSIVGTFVTGFYLVSWIGTQPTIMAVGIVLGLMGVLFGLVRFWPLVFPAAALFILIYSQGVLPYEVVERDGRSVVREKPGTDELYIEESDYCYIKVDRTLKKGVETRRDLVMDSLIHAEWVPERPNDLQYEYEKIYQAITHRFSPIPPVIPGDEAPPEGPVGPGEDAGTGGDGKDAEAPAAGGEGAGAVAAGEARKAPGAAAAGGDASPPAVAVAEKGLPACLFLGGGGYVYPRYLRSVWPDCYVEVAEIDPAVTAADVAEFGLEADRIQIVDSPRDLDRDDNPMWIYHLDARNHVDDMLRRKASGDKRVPEFDFIFGDAFNFLGVPAHLTTKEFNEKLKALLRPGQGIYMINIIDIFKSGKFVGAIYNTFREVFDHVYVLCTNEDEPDMRDTGRDTFIVIGSLRELDLSGLPGKEAPFEFTGCVLNEKHLKELEGKAKRGDKPLILVDDFAPVENLLEYVVNRWRLRD